MHRRTRLLAGLLILSLLLTACSGKAATGSKEAALQAANDMVTLKIAAFHSAVLDAQLHAFYESHPSVRVEFVRAPAESQTSPGAVLAYMRQSAIAGDVDLTPVVDDLLLNANYLLDVEPLAEKSGFDLKPFGNLDGLKSKGRLYQLPFNVDPQVLVYNQDLFQARQVPAPKDDWTWDEFRLAAQKLTQTTETQRTWGFDSAYPERLLALYARDPGEQRTREALQFFATMTFTDKSMPPAAPDPTATHPNRFAAGQAAMTFLTLSQVSQMAGGMHWDVAPMPHLPGQKAITTILFQGLAISANSKHPAEAWELLQYLTGEKGAVVAAASGVVPGYRTPAVRDAWFKRTPAPAPGTAALFATDWHLPEVSAGPPMDEARVQQVADLGWKMTAAIRHALAEEGRWEQDLAEYLQWQKELAALTTP